MTARNKNLDRIFKKYSVNTAYLFGSQATGKTHKHSDYDFAVQLSDRVLADEFFDYKIGLTNELLKVVDSEFINLVVLNNRRVPLLLKFNIIKDGKVIYDKAPQIRKDIEFKIMRNWLDQEYFERLWHNIFIKNLAQGKIL